MLNSKFIKYTIRNRWIVQDWMKWTGEKKRMSNCMYQNGELAEITHCLNKPLQRGFVFLCVCDVDLIGDALNSSSFVHPLKRLKWIIPLKTDIIFVYILHWENCNECFGWCSERVFFPSSSKSLSLGLGICQSEKAVHLCKCQYCGDAANIPKNFSRKTRISAFLSKLCVVVAAIQF